MILEKIKKELNQNENSVSANSKYFKTKYLYLGISYPKLNEISKLIKRDEIEEFLNENDFSSIELNIINSIMISKLKDYDKALGYLKKALPYIDNWATSDKLSSCFKIAKKNKKAFSDMLELIKTDEVYYVRVGLIVIMSHLLESSSFPSIFDTILQINNDDYYVKMAISWLLATMAIYDKDAVFNFLKNNNLSTFVNNKTLSKMRESYRIDEMTKQETYKYKK